MRLAHRIRTGLLLVSVGLTVPGYQSVAAQSPKRTPPSADTIKAAPPIGAPVVVGPDTLFMLYGRLGPFDAADRAQAASERIAALRAAHGAGIDSVTAAAIEGRWELVTRDQVLVTILDADAAQSGRSPEVAAREDARIIERATAAARAATTFRAIMLDAAYALAATVVLALLLLVVRRVFRRLYAFFAGPRLPPLRVQRFELLSSARLGDGLTVIARSARTLLTILMFYVYLPLVLSFFPWTQPMSRRIVGYVTTPLRSLLNGFLAYLPNVLFAIIIVIVARYVIKVIRLIFEAIGSGALAIDGFHPDWARPTYGIVRFLVVAFAAVVMWPYLPGSGSDAFKGVSLFVGVLVSLGSSGAVGNIVAGVVLTYTQAFRVGDRVEIGATTGDVMEKTLLVTRLRTIKNVEVTIPNGTVLATQVINYSTLAASRGLILHTTVTIGYDAPWAKVHQLLIDAAVGTEDIMPTPAPFVLQTSLDDFFVSYQINAYTDQPAKMAVTYSNLHRNIQDRFNAAGVEIMSPHYASLRDGNRVTTPAEQVPSAYQPPAFVVDARVRRADGA